MDADEVADIFASFGPVKCRRMFGGLGIYADGVMFALSGFGEIYLKADDALAARLGRRARRPPGRRGVQALRL
jgi:DNA transformation protein